MKYSVNISIKKWSMPIIYLCVIFGIKIPEFCLSLILEEVK